MIKNSYYSIFSNTLTQYNCTSNRNNNTYSTSTHAKNKFTDVSTSVLIHD